jgi:RNA polymerase sigma factor (sigma-70 family)
VDRVPADGAEDLTWPALVDALEEDLVARDGVRLDADDPTPTERDSAWAWAELSRRVNGAAVVVVRTMGTSPQLDADDLTQDVLLLLQNPDRLRRLRSVASPGAYLIVMVRHIALDRLRRAGAQDRLRSALQREAASLSYPSLEDSDASLAAAEVFRRLSEEELLLVRLRFWEDLPIEEIARRLGTSYAAVAQRLSKLIRRLHNDLQSI